MRGSTEECVKSPYVREDYMGNDMFAGAIEILQEQFTGLDWTYYDSPHGSSALDKADKMYKWPGDQSDEVIICVHKSNDIQEIFHRHDFFFFNYTYKGQYESLSHKYDNKITIYENELYAGQPFAGHALYAHDNTETIIIGVLIQKRTFFHSFLPLLTANFSLLHFLLDPSVNSFSDEFIHFKLEKTCHILQLIELMVLEYAYKQSDTQNVLKPLVLSFLTMVARQYSSQNKTEHEKLSDRIVQYISEHIDTVTLKELSKQFPYHPNYISNLLSQKIGKTFSQIKLEQRMSKSIILLNNTTLSISEIALMLGYSNSSNFYKDFKDYYQLSPREYVKNRLQV